MVNYDEYVNSIKLVDKIDVKGKYAIIEKNGRHYYASMSDLGCPFWGPIKGEKYQRFIDLLDSLGGRCEVQIFACDENGEVESWDDLYCRRTDKPSDKFLRECIKEFLEE